MVFEIFCPIAILACVSSNSFGYVQKQAVDLIIDCMAKWKFYARILCIFFLLHQIKSKLHVLCDILTPAAFWLACFLNSFDYMQDQEIARTFACVAK